MPKGELICESCGQYESECQCNKKGTYYYLGIHEIDSIGLYLTAEKVKTYSKMAKFVMSIAIIQLGAEVLTLVLYEWLEDKFQKKGEK
jgi:hypothetical protein